MLDDSIISVIIKVAAVLVGIGAGCVQFYLLYKFVTSVTGGKSGTKTLLFAITQFLFPFVILVICAFVLPDSLMWVGIGIATSLIACAIIKFVVVPKQKNASGKKTQKIDTQRKEKK